MLHPTFGNSDSCAEEGNNAQSITELFSNYLERFRVDKDHQQIHENPYLKNMASSKRMLNLIFFPSLKFAKVEENIINIIEIEDEGEDSEMKEKPRLQKLL
ncbi:MAG: hypothetical protein HYX61_04505 [Gammaproteobacteria bacterium]|jgi:hypothetical protein|nr:hypothetical protein [Gammaproteobacteria bacterium]